MNLVEDLPQEGGSKKYIYDPELPTPYVGGRSFNPTNSGPKDQRSFERRDDVIIFSSNKLEKAVRIIGTVTASILATCSIPCLDIVVRLCDVSKDGKSINVCDGMMRKEEPACEFSFSFDVSNIAYEFASGHRIRIQICSGAHPKWMRNLGTGEPVASAVRLKRAHVEVHSGSSVTLPVHLPPHPDTAMPIHRM